MEHFMIRFFICNIFISGIIGILFITKWLCKKMLSSRMQYHLWILLLGLLIIPFMPLRFTKPFSWMNCLPASSTFHFSPKNNIATASTEATNWMNDFTTSVSGQATSKVEFLLGILWLGGILVMLLFIAKSWFQLYQLKKSALSLQNRQVHQLYQQCLTRLNIKKGLPIYSTAFLKSPILVGYIKPSIYLPIHLISDFNATDIRYMLLHELSHYKHKDMLINLLMNLAGVIYWFNPFVWLALRAMRTDREVACDTSVLETLSESDYEEYGHTLINFAQKISLSPFPFAAGISGNMRQMKKRIMNIAAYETPSLMQRFKRVITFILIETLLFSLAPLLSPHASDTSYYRWNASNKNVTYVDYSSYFNDYEGSFVLYDLKNNTWDIYNMKNATLRVSPNSTYKIYDALFALEEGVISPSNSFLSWNGKEYPFEPWNKSQTLNSAMNASVNWYFQDLDQQLGTDTIRNYIKKIGYGNQSITGDLSSYWMEASLKISPLEQVELLEKLYCNDFGFAPESMNAVKSSICISSKEAGALYGKTGTGRINGKDVNGWFVGYIETSENTYFFATNIRAASNATGSQAVKITRSILSDRKLWKKVP